MKKENRINIPVMFCFDTNYVIPAAAAFYSLLEHANKKYDYTFYVLHSDITDYQQAKLRETISEFSNCVIEYIDMNHRFDDIWNKIYHGDHFSKEVMYKLLVASIFPNIDKLVVSDVDVIFLGDISDSYFELTDEDDAYIAGVKPIGKVLGYLDSYYPVWTREEISKLGNVCGGYLVMNLKKIREDNFEEVFLKSIDENSNRLNQMEQDIFNITCYGKIKHLHLKYVACSYMWDYYKTDEDKETDCNYSKKEIDEAMEHPVQLHYATSTKPWKNVDCTLSAIWFEYIVKTPFAQEFFNSLPMKIIIPESRLVKTSSVEVVENKNNDGRIKRVIKHYFPKIKYVLKNPSIFFKKKNYKKLKRKLFKKNYSYVIFDDIFPSSISLYRYGEYFEYSLSNFNTYFAVSGKKYDEFKFDKSFEDVILTFQIKNPHCFDRVFNLNEKYRSESLEKIKQLKNPFAIVGSIDCIINDEFNYLDYLEENNIPFVLTLYPDDSLKVGDKESDKKLKSIFSSKCFRKVIVTQENVKNYLLDNDFCKENNIELVEGYVLSEDVFEKSKKQRLFYPEKKFFEVCYVPHSYLDNDVKHEIELFIDIAKKVVKKDKTNKIRFRIISDFDKKDFDLGEAEDIIKFYKPLDEECLLLLYKKTDIFVSLNKTSNNSFSSFLPPNLVAAMMMGIVTIITDDELNKNMFVPNEDLLVVEQNASSIADKILEIYNDNDKYFNISKCGKVKAKKLYSISNQACKRLNIVKSIAEKEYK